MSVTVRRAHREDAPTILQLIAALADYESLPPPDADAQARFVTHGWPGDNIPPRFSAWLAEVPTDTVPVAVGYAITFDTYSTFLARPTLYLEDIFVLPEHRGIGAGKALLSHLIALAKAEGYGRVDWVVLDWNISAQQFYQRIGARHLTEWQCYRVEL